MAKKKVVKKQLVKDVPFELRITGNGSKIEFTLDGKHEDIVDSVASLLQGCKDFRRIILEASAQSVLN